MHLTINRVFDDAGAGVLGAVTGLFMDWSLFLGIGLIMAAVVSSALTRKVPWTREGSVWLYSLAATACFAVHWAAAPA